MRNSECTDSFYGRFTMSGAAWVVDASTILNQNPKGRIYVKGNENLFSNADDRLRQCLNGARLRSLYE